MTMMKDATLTNREVLEAEAALSGVSTYGLAPRLLYRLVRNQQALASARRTIEATTAALQRRHVLRDEEGDPVYAEGPDGAPDESRIRVDVAAYEEDLEAVLGEEVVLRYAPIPASMLAEAHLPLSALAPIGYLVEDDAC